MQLDITSFPRRRLIGSFLIYSLSSWLVWVALGLALGSLGLTWAHTWLPSGCPCAPWGSHGVLGGSLGLPWGSLGVPLGVPRGPYGVLWGSLEVPWAPLGLSWGSSGVPRGSLWGPLGRLGVNMTIFSDLSKIGCPIPSKCVYLHAPAHKKLPCRIHPRIPRILRIPRIRPKWRKGRRSQPHFSRRGPG